MSVENFNSTTSMTAADSSHKLLVDSQPIKQDPLAQGNLYAPAIIGGLFGAITGAMGTGMESPTARGLGLGLVEGAAGAEVGALVDTGLNKLFPSVDGHALFARNGIESFGIGIALAAPIPDLKVRLGLAATAWLGGKVYNWFER